MAKKVIKKKDSTVKREKFSKTLPTPKAKEKTKNGNKKK